MPDNFEICLAWILERECGYPQTIGTGYVRLSGGWRWDGSSLVDPNGRRRGLPSKPDGMAYDDDPHDTGGRTCMGVVQRVYDAFRDRARKPRQDVWRILDSEIRQIYYEQYWTPLRAGEMPLHVALCVFDMGVNAGIGTGARILQRATGAVVDGHVGAATLRATQIADQANPEALLKRIHAERVKYYKQCKTYWKHGKGWLRRNDLTHARALKLMVSPAPKPEFPTGLVYDEPPNRAKATPGEQSEAQTSARTAEGVTATGVAGAGASAAKAVKDAPPEASSWDVLLALLADPVIWLFLITVAGGVFIWLERRRLARLVGA